MTFSEIDIEQGDVVVLNDCKTITFAQRDQNRSNLASLYVQKLGKNGKLGTSEEILEGLESMQIQYGEDTNNDNSPNYYVSADEVSNWANVVSIRLSLFMRSFKDNLLAEPQNINFNGAKVRISDGDSYLRRVYSSTIALRNRNLGY